MRGKKKKRIKQKETLTSKINRYIYEKEKKNPKKEKMKDEEWFCRYYTTC